MENVPFVGIGVFFLPHINENGIGNKHVFYDEISLGHE